jgi:FAD/FMN-containing dehydrogenase
MAGQVGSAAGTAENLVTELAAGFPPDFLATDPDTLQAYGTDWTRVYQPRPLAIAFPRTTGEVARLLARCQERDVAVVPSGGRTGLAGGAVAARGELVVSLDRMRRVDPVSRASRTVRVQAGAVTRAVHEHCLAEGLVWPVDFASAGSSQIGGNIATNAGGIHVVRYGSTRAWVLGLEAVTMAGEVLELGGALEKDNSGLDLKQLIIGSEGTLAVITEATLKLATRIPGRSVAFLAVPTLGAALELFGSLGGRPEVDLHAFEYLTPACLEIVLARRGLPRPLGAGAAGYVLTEVAAPTADAAREVLENWLSADEVAAELILDGVVSQSAAQASSLWQLREGIGEALANEGLLHKCDIAVPVDDLPAFSDELTALHAEVCPALELFVFGHVGDGNLHINLRKPPAMAPGEFFRTCEAIDEHIWRLVRRHRGSISAEHGIGLLKKKALSFTRTPRELEIARAVKRAFDPKGLLNPGKILDSDRDARGYLSNPVTS